MSKLYAGCDANGYNSCIRMADSPWEANAKIQSILDIRKYLFLLPLFISQNLLRLFFGWYEPLQGENEEFAGE